MKKILVAVVLGGWSYAADFYVPAGCVTIQLAVNAANSGDNIYVSAGSYNEAVYINKRINLVGAGVNVCTITAQGLGTNAVTFDGNSAYESAETRTDGQDGDSAEFINEVAIFRIGTVGIGQGGRCYFSVRIK